MEAISNDELERRFDEGEDITAYMDMSSARRPNLENAPVHVDLNMPVIMVRGIDRAAARMGVSREAVINVWLAERLDEEDSRRAARVLAPV